MLLKKEKEQRLSPKEYMYHWDNPFPLECGKELSHLKIAYTTIGELNSRKDNVVWICHALTGNANPLDWWNGLIHAEAFDPENYFIVCANVLGSCYGTTGPADIDPETGIIYGKQFPLVTVRDMVTAHELLREHLGIQSIEILTGGSLGGQQVLEWAIYKPGLFKRIAVFAANARHSAWGIAFNEAQRMAIEADPNFELGIISQTSPGLRAARAMAMLSYRTPEIYNLRQTNSDSRTDHFDASGYQVYQGKKLEQRFNIFSYYTLSKAMDSHNVARGRGSVSDALSLIEAETLIVGIQSDLLFPLQEQEFLNQKIQNSKLKIIDSIYGHDGFLLETTKISTIIKEFLK